MCCIKKRDDFATSCQFSIRIWSNNLNKNNIILHDPCTFHSIHHIFLVQVTTLTKAGVRACKILVFGTFFLVGLVEALEHLFVPVMLLFFINILQR